MHQDYAPTNKPEQRSKDTSIVVTGNPDFSLKINGFAQAEYTLTDNEGTPLVQSFDVALARLAFSGTVFGSNVSYFFQLNASTLGNTNQVSLIDAWLQYGFSPLLSIQVGRFVLPYSREFYTHPGNLLFADLSQADYAFNLPRSIGVALTGSVIPHVSYYLTATNSIRDLSGSGQQNTTNALASIGRLEFDILSPYGYLESSPEDVEHPQLSVGVAGAVNRAAENATFQNVRAGETTKNLTADTGFRVNRLSVQGAYYHRQTNAITGYSDSHDNGFYGQAGFYLVPSKWELATRYSWVKFGENQGVGSQAQTRATDVGMNYYIHGNNLKIQSDFDWIKNTSFAGDTSPERVFRIQTQVLF